MKVARQGCVDFLQEEGQQGLYWNVDTSGGVVDQLRDKVFSKPSKTWLQERQVRGVAVVISVY